MKYTPGRLYWDIDNNRIDHVLFHLHHGLNINSRDQFGRSLLHNAVSCVRPQIVSLFLKRGANVRQRHKSCKSTLLHVLARSVRTRDTLMDFEACVHLLIESGLKWNTLDIEQLTPFGVGLKYRCSVEALRILIQCGANVNRVGKPDHAALHLPLKESWVRQEPVLEILRFLLDEQKLSIQQLNGNGENVLFHVSQREKNSVKIMTYLIESGIDINVVSKSGKTAFAQAVHKKQFIQAVVNSGRLFEFNHHLCGDEFKSNLIRMKCIVLMKWIMDSSYYMGRSILCTGMLRHLSTFL